MRSSKKQTYIMQLVEKRPEMPGELGLNKERRNHLAELMLEYPTQADEMEKESPARENAGEKRYYTCQNIGKPYSAIRGKLNRLENNPKLKNVPQKESFINKRQDFGRTFNDPYGLKAHQKYICAQQESDEIEEEPTNAELTRQKKTQYMPLLDADESREEEKAEEEEKEERGKKRKRTLQNKTETTKGKRGDTERIHGLTWQTQTTETNTRKQSRNPTI